MGAITCLFTFPRYRKSQPDVFVTISLFCIIYGYTLDILLDFFIPHLAMRVWTERNKGLISGTYFLISPIVLGANGRGLNYKN